MKEETDLCATLCIFALLRVQCLGRTITREKQFITCSIFCVAMGGNVFDNRYCNTNLSLPLSGCAYAPMRVTPNCSVHIGSRWPKEIEFALPDLFSTILVKYKRVVVAVLAENKLNLTI